jgi:FxsC-like protein
MAIFRQRIDTYARERGLRYPPPLIFPVLLERLLEPVPEAIAYLQYDNDRYPPAYRDLRLRRLLQSNAGRPRAQEVIDVLAEDIIRAIREHQLPALDDRPSIDSVPGLFGASNGPLSVPTAAAPATRSQDLVGPSFVRFFFVAGRRDELQALRHKVDNYGPVEGMTWQPYFPKIERFAPVLAQEIATKLNMIGLPQTLDASAADQFMEQLHQAQANKNVVVLLVDTWSLCLDRYLNLMRSYDGVDLWNTSVLVVWNYDDDETRLAMPKLNNKLNVAFTAKRNRNDPYVLREIGTAAEFSENLSDLLAKVQLKIVEVTDQIARADGDVFIARPIISGTAPR